MSDDFWKGIAVGAGVIGGLWWLDNRRAKQTQIQITAGSGALPQGKGVSPLMLTKEFSGARGKPAALEGGLHPVNPRTLAEFVSGRRIQWDSAKEPRSLVESALGLPWSTLVDPRAPVSLYRPGKLIANARRTPITGATTRGVDSFFRAQGLACNSWDRIVAKDRISWAMLYARRQGLSDAQLGELLLAANRQCAPFDGFVDGYWAPIGPMFSGSPKVTDPCQGIKPNCWFVSYIASLAWVRPDLVLAQSFRSRETPHGEVLEFEFVNGDTGAVDRVRMDNAVPCRTIGAFGGRDAMGMEIAPFTTFQLMCHSLNGVAWPALFEKARAVWNYGTDRPSAFGPDSLELGSGWSLDVEMMNRGTLDATVFGRRVTAAQANASILDTIAPTGRARRVARAGTTDQPDEWVTQVRTYGSDLSLVCGHAYSVLGQIKTGGKTYVVLRNPWGNTPARHPSFTLPPGTPWLEGLVLDRDGVFALELEAFAYFFRSINYAETQPWFPALG